MKGQGTTQASPVLVCWQPLPHTPYCPWVEVGRGKQASLTSAPGPHGRHTGERPAAPECSCRAICVTRSFHTSYDRRLGKSGK